MKKYQTKQRRELLTFFKEHNSRQYTVEEIAAFFTGENRANISASAIYRNLPGMVDEGLVAKFSAAKSNKLLYQYIGEEACGHHLHFKCEGCGRIFHIDNAVTNRLLAVAMEKSAFTVDKKKTVLYGVCGHCTQEA